MSKKSIRILLYIFVLLTLIIHVLDFYRVLALSPVLLFSTRMAVCFLLIVYGLRKRKLTTWILISMYLGAEIGHDMPGAAIHLRIVGQVFLKLIKCIIGPLLFATLAFGIAGHSNIRQVGRMAWKSLLYFEIVTTLALLIGLIAVNITKPGVGVTLHSAETDSAIQVSKHTWEETVLHLFPENIAKAVAEGQILQIVIFSILFGIGLAMVKDHLKAPMLTFLEGLSETMFKFTNIIMYAAPFAVGAAIAYTVSHQGIGVLFNLLNLLVTLYCALLAFLLVVLLPVALMCKIPIRKFIKAISEPVSLAFATTSSEAALPKAMEALEKMGVSRKIIAFVMPMGYSFNLDGTTLYLALASVFVAQAAGIQLSIEQQLLMVLTLMLTSKGVAGVPRASLVVLLATAGTFGLPVEPIFIILGIDELMDMARTSVNVIGNCLATVVVAKWEGEFRPDLVKGNIEE